MMRSSRRRARCKFCACPAGAPAAPRLGRDDDRASRGRLVVAGGGGGDAAAAAAAAEAEVEAEEDRAIGATQLALGRDEVQGLNIG